MGGLSYDRDSEIPEGMRRLIEEKLAKTKQRQEINPPAAPEPTFLPVSAKRKMRKYRNLPTERLLPNGECIKFQSKKEALRYDYLRMEQEAGRIRKLRLQVQFLIQASYTDGETGEHFRGASYFADFCYERLEDGKWVAHVEDTKGGGRKGTATKTYQLKRKMVEAQGTHIEEV